MYSIGCITNLRMYKVNMKMQTLTYFNVLKTVFNSKENSSHIFFINIFYYFLQPARAYKGGKPL